MVSCLCRIVASDKKKTLLLERNSVYKGHKSPLTVTVTSSSICIFLQARHLSAFPLFFFVFFSSSFLESRLVGFYFEGHLKGPVLYLFLSL